MKLNYLLLLLFIPFLTACDRSDDLMGIFTGKTWKLTEVRYDNDKLYKEYWLSTDGKFNQDAYDNSIKLKAVKGNFTLVFTGIEVDQKLEGQYNGKATNETLSGNCYIDGKKKTFQTSNNKESNDNDILGKAFARAIANAESYEGDFNNLRIYFKEGQVKKYLLMHIERD